MIWEATIHHVTINDKGNDKAVKASYLLENKELFAEVENELFETFGTLTDFEVCAIKISKIKEIANRRETNEDKIFLATLVDVFLQDDGSEKELKYTIAFYSKNMESAHNYVRNYVSQGYNMSVQQIKESKFLEVL